jgi:low affinity Fe/Cu permease
MSSHIFGRALTKLGEWATHPAAFGLVLLYVAAWLILDRKSLDWHAVTELIVLCMTLFIVRSEHRDTQGIHAKLDEVLRAEGRASKELTGIDHREPEEIEEHRQQRRAENKKARMNKPTPLSVTGASWRP